MYFSVTNSDRFAKFNSDCIENVIYSTDLLENMSHTFTYSPGYHTFLKHIRFLTDLTTK